MVDFRVDDGFPQHPKTLGMSLEAIGAWTLIGCWCARYRTDGAITDDGLKRITGRTKIVEELAARHLIARIAGGWEMVDWAQYQRTKQELEDERERQRERQRRWREKRKERDDG